MGPFLPGIGQSGCSIHRPGVVKNNPLLAGASLLDGAGCLGNGGLLREEGEMQASSSLGCALSLLLPCTCSMTRFPGAESGVMPGEQPSGQNTSGPVLGTTSVGLWSKETIKFASESPSAKETIFLAMTRLLYPQLLFIPWSAVYVTSTDTNHGLAHRSVSRVSRSYGPVTW